MDRLGGYFGTHDADEPLDDFVDDADVPAEAPPSPVGQDERRMQVRAYNHWASLLGERNFPHVDDLEPHTLDDFGPYSVLLDFTNGIDDPVVRFVGTALADECGEDAALLRLSDVPSRSVLSRITDHYMQILANQAPIGFEAEFVNDRALTVLYRGILLPYSSDNQTIDFIYGVINWKEMADQSTADELLLEIGQSLGDYGDEDADDDDIETVESLTGQGESDMDDNAHEVFDLGHAHMVGDDDDTDLPQPAFGTQTPAEAPVSRAHRGIDALGNPIGAAPQDEEEYFDEEEAFGDFDSGMKTAADYGLPDWDDDEEEDDVDGLVDPLAEDDSSSSLMSLVSRGERTKKSVDLSHGDPSPAVPQSYDADASDTFDETDGYADEAPAFVPEPPTITFSPPDYFLGYEDEDEDEDEDEEPYGAQWSDASPADAVKDHDLEDEVESSPDSDDIFELTAELAPVEDEVLGVDDPVVDDSEDILELHAEVESDDHDEVQGDPAIVVEELAAADTETPEGLYVCLAAARELALAAQNTEDRSRKALYQAVGLAYDFSLETESDPEGFAELLEDNGLTVQDRAPMTPVVKLVFGADYDKTRLTEYAAVLMHAHRIGVERGTLTRFLEEAEGGLKAVVNAERRARKEEQGRPVEDSDGVRASLARQLRELDPVGLEDIAVDGAEFALVMVRRTPEGELVIIGEVPDDVPLVERAARKLLG